MTPAMRLQILAAEHSSLSASRALAWNETFSRASMFLSLLSGAIVALALVGPASRFDQSFQVFGLVILPLVLFVGLATFARIGAANYHDAQCVIGMNRIRAGYLEVAPHLARFLVMSPHDDVRGVGVTMAVTDGYSPLVHLLSATPTIIMVVDSVVAAAIAALVVQLLGADLVPVLVVGVAIFVISFAAHLRFGRTSVARAQASLRPRFPTPTAEGANDPVP